MKRLALVALVALGVACGGAAAVQAPARPPPAAVMALQVDVAARGGRDTFCPALAAGLARSGIQLTTDTSQADAIILCRTDVSEEPSLVRLTYNGRTRMHYTVTVEVRSGTSHAAVDSFVAEYSAYGDAPDEDAIAKTVIGFAYSPRIAAFARQVRRARAAAATPQAEATETAPAPTSTAPRPDDRDDRDDRDWFAIDTVQCKIPARVEACAPVRRYLQHHPEGAHAAEARAILAAAQPALEKLQKDDVAWRKSNRSLCASRRTADACVGVEAYELEFPTGLHAEEAQRLLRAAGRK